MRLAVLGDPVEHSLSPLLHRTALHECRIAGTYDAITVDEAGMRQAVIDLREGVLDGANVTMPHKRLAYDLCDRVSGRGGVTSAVNTLVRVDHEVVGHNTDIGGVQRAWGWAGLPPDGPVELYGAGGAAAAALIALSDRPVTVRARRPERAEELVARIGFGAAAAWGPPAEGAVLVNATPIGMHGGSFPDAWFGAISGVFDMAYGPRLTATVASARLHQLPHAAGVDMLLGQALDAFWLWTGRQAPVDAMRRALEARV